MKKAFISIVSMVATMSFIVTGCGAGSGSGSGSGMGAAKPNKDYFEWSENYIRGFSDAGLKQKEIIIPADCEGFYGSLDDGACTKVSFESDNDIDIGLTFNSSSKLESISLPKNISSLYSMAFQDCTALKSIEIPNSLTELPSFTFAGCSSLTDVSLPGSLTTIGSYCFCDCTSLKSITLPSSLKVLDISAFAGCTSLTSIDLPEGLEEIDDSVFDNCTAMTSLKIPSSVKTVGYDILLGSGITDVYIPADLEFTDWDSGSFYSDEVMLTVHVTEGSWADLNFDDVFLGAQKTYE